MPYTALAGALVERAIESPTAYREGVFWPRVSNGSELLTRIGVEELTIL